MKYQLVLQFPMSSIEDYDSIVAFEDVVIDALGSIGELDGHDAGSGEMNLYIYTDTPQEAFERLKTEIPPDGPLSHVRAAYRIPQTDRFTVLYPADVTSFSIT